MKRGEIWTAAAGSGYVGKPRPVVIIQSDAFDATDSVTVCPFTTNSADATMLRILVSPDEENHLSRECSVMVEKLSTFHRSKLGQRIGTLDDQYMRELQSALVVFLGLVP